MSSSYNFIRNNRFKRLRNKDSYVCAFLDLRKKAADFAIKDKNKYDCKYEKPFYIIKNEEELLELKKKNQKQMNTIRNKSEFYNTYNTLKKSLAKKNNNSSSSNKVIIEKENNKYYLVQEFDFKKKEKKSSKKNSDESGDNNDINKKYNNIKNHTINVSSKPKKKLDNDNVGRNYSSWKNLQIQKTTSLNNYESLDNIKKEKEIDIIPHPDFTITNEYEYCIDSNRNKKYNNCKEKNNLFKKENNINLKVEKSQNNNIYYEGENNHKYSESLVKNEYISKYKYDLDDQKYENLNYYPKNFSEPQNVYDRVKNIYSLKDTQIKPKYELKNNYNYDYKSKINELSPIKTNYHYDLKEYNENTKNKEKIYDNIETLNSNINSKSDTNIKIKNNLILTNDNNIKDIKNSKQDLNLGYCKYEKDYNLCNTNKENNEMNMDSDSQKLRNAGIIYKNRKYYINDNLDIPFIINNNSKDNDLDKKFYINNNLNENTKENNNDIIPKEKLENEITDLNDINKDINNNENTNKLNTEKDIYSIENKSQPINISSNNNEFNTIKPKENNNNKIKNIKTQSYKKISEGHNYESLKEKYESFLKPREEKEPNIQSKVISSMLSSKDEFNNNNKNNNNNKPLENNNKSLVRNIQEKIQILKNNKIQSKRESNNYINEIDECYSKIKSKEEKDNLTLRNFYAELLQKEKEQEKDDNYYKKKEKKEKIQKTVKEKEYAKENSKTIEDKRERKVFIQKSKRLEYIMRNLINNRKYNYYDYHYLSNKLNKSRTKSTNKENIDINNVNYFGNSAPDINLIVDQSNEHNIKLIDENEFSKLRKKNLRSEKLIGYNTINNNISNKNGGFRNQTSLKNSDNYTNSYKYLSPRLIIRDITHKIMPPNEL